MWRGLSLASWALRSTGGVFAEGERAGRAIVAAAEGQAGCGGGAISRAGERDIFAVDGVGGGDEERAAVDLEGGVGAESAGMSRIEHAGTHGGRARAGTRA